jgi:hypothetical protein
MRRKTGEGKYYPLSRYTSRSDRYSPVKIAVNTSTTDVQGVRRIVIWTFSIFPQVLALATAQDRACRAGAEVVVVKGAAVVTSDEYAASVGASHTRSASDGSSQNGEAEDGREVHGDWFEGYKVRLARRNVN